MGMAHKPPTSIYDRERYISEHALQRFRERTVGTELVHRDDDDLGNALDEAVCEALRHGVVPEQVNDKGDPAQLIEITNHLPHKVAEVTKPVFALIKSNTYRRSPYSEAIVTVLNKDQVDTMRHTRWKSTEPFNPAFAGLQQLKKQFVKQPDPPKPVAPKAPAKPFGVLRSTPTMTAQTKTVLITYYDAAHEHGMVAEEFATDAARERIAQLYEDPNVDPSSVRLWTEKPLAVKRVVKVDFEL